MAKRKPRPIQAASVAAAAAGGGTVALPSESKVKVVQVIVGLVLAEIGADGEVGPLSPPVQMPVSGREWNREWATDKSREAFAYAIDQELKRSGRFVDIPVGPPDA